MNSFSLLILDLFLFDRATVITSDTLFILPTGAILPPRGQNVVLREGAQKYLNSFSLTHELMYSIHVVLKCHGEGGPMRIKISEKAL